MKLSILATVYKDAEIVNPLVDEILKYIIPLNIDYEIILVNDCSNDDSEQAIINECNKNPKVKGISLRRNFGQQIAMSAGMHYASGTYIVIMDGDLQNPPSAIPLLLDTIQKSNHDIVYTVSKNRNDLWDTFTSYLFWTIITRFFGLKIVKHQLMMKIMTKDFVEQFSKYGELKRTIDGIVDDISSYYGVIEVENSVRQHGKSHYTFTKRINLMIDIIISLSSAPLNLLIYLGFIILLLTFLGWIYYLSLYLFSHVPAGYTSVLLSIFFFGSLIVLILGIIGRYLANIYAEVRGRPLYHIKTKYNL
jgi:glycosyltransferase involved in cell wall biosynthesis